MIELYNADCVKILKDMVDNGRKVDFCFTSPPYNRKRNDKYNNYEDKKVDYYEFLCEVTDLNLSIGKYLFLNIQKNYYNKTDVFKFIGKYADKIIDIICWTKTKPMPASGNNITNAYEFIIILSNTEKSIKSNGTYTKNLIQTNVYSNNPYKAIHRAVMNPEVVDWFLDTFTLPEQTIMDCFMGVGTTGDACLKKGRSFIGMELDETYFSIAQSRIYMDIEVTMNNGVLDIQTTFDVDEQFIAELKDKYKCEQWSVVLKARIINDIIQHLYH